MTFIRKNIIYLILLIVLLLIAVIPGLKDKISEQFFPVATIENAVTISKEDLDINLKGINVPNTNLKNFKSKKIIFLNFWGTWCPPCREEWPTIQKLYNSKKNNVDFVLIAMQDQEDKVKEYLFKNKFTVPVYVAESPISEKILPKVFPTTYLINNQGRILMKEDASKDWNSSSVYQFINNITK